MSEIQEVKEDIKEIKSDQKEVIKAVTDLQLLVAGQYVTKKEFEKHKTDDDTSHETITSRLNNLIIGVASAAILFLLNLLAQHYYK